VLPRRDGLVGSPGLLSTPGMGSARNRAGARTQRHAEGLFLWHASPGAHTVVASNAAAGAQELSCTVLGKPQSGAGNTRGAPAAVPPQRGLTGSLEGLSLPREARPAAPCTEQACLGIALASKACGCRQPAPECGQNHQKSRMRRLPWQC